MIKIIIRLPYSDDEFKYDILISDLDKFLHKQLDKDGWKFEIIKEEEE